MTIYSFILVYLLAASIYDVGKFGVSFIYQKRANKKLLELLEKLTYIQPSESTEEISIKQEKTNLH